MVWITDGASIDGTSIDGTGLVVRIDVRRLAKMLLLWELLPISIVVLIDFSAQTFPILTLAATLIIIPFSSFFVLRAALSEFDRVIQEVAPEQPEGPEGPEEPEEPEGPEPADSAQP